MKKAKFLICALMAFMMLFNCTASAAEIFQWLVEPSLTYEYVYYDNAHFYEGYWQVGQNDEQFDIVDSYGNVLQSNVSYDNPSPVQTVEDYTVEKIGDGQYRVSDASGAILFISPYEVTAVLNGSLFQICTEVPTEWGWVNYAYGAMDTAGRVVLEPQYDIVQYTGYNNWVLFGTDKYGIIDASGAIVFNMDYAEITYNNDMVLCLQDSNNANVIIDKATGKMTVLNGSVTPFYYNFNWPCYDTDEFLFDGVLMNSRGEALTEKTNRLQATFSQLGGGSTNLTSIFTGATYNYMGNDCYSLIIDEYTPNQKSYCVNADGQVIASDFDYALENWPGRYALNYHNGDSSDTKIIDRNGNVLFQGTNENVFFVTESIVQSWKYIPEEYRAAEMLYYMDGTTIGDFNAIYNEGDYFMIRDKNDKIGFAKCVRLPDVDISNKIVLLVGEKDTYVYGTYKANDVKTIIRNDRTMIPIRSVAEALGATVGWNDATKEVTIQKAGTSISIAIGASYATVNGQALAIDSPAFIENNRTYLPVRFVSEALGATVNWDPETSAVIIQ